MQAPRWCVWAGLQRHQQWPLVFLWSFRLAPFDVLEGIKVCVKADDGADVVLFHSSKKDGVCEVEPSRCIQLEGRNQHQFLFRVRAYSQAFEHQDGKQAPDDLCTRYIIRSF